MLSRGVSMRPTLTIALLALSTCVSAATVKVANSLPVSKMPYDLCPNSTVEYWGTGFVNVTDENIDRILIIQHGLGREAQSSLASAQAVAKGNAVTNGDPTKTLIIAPQFPVYTKERIWNTTVLWDERGWIEGQLPVSEHPEGLFSYTVYDKLLTTAMQSLPNLKHINFLGFSAGAQFLQHYAATSPLAHSLLASYDVRFVIGSPSTYLYLDKNRPNLSQLDSSSPQYSFRIPTTDQYTCQGTFDDWKYGLTAAKETTYGLNATTYAFSMPKLTKQYLLDHNFSYMVGSKDTGVPADNRCPAQMQGKTRVSRAQAFWKYMEMIQKKKGIKTSVVACDHSEQCAFRNYPFAGQALFE